MSIGSSNEALFNSICLHCFIDTSKGVAVTVGPTNYSEMFYPKFDMNLLEVTSGSFGCCTTLIKVMTFADNPSLLNFPTFSHPLLLAVTSSFLDLRTSLCVTSEGSDVRSCYRTADVITRVCHVAKHWPSKGILIGLHGSRQSSGVKATIVNHEYVYVFLTLLWKLPNTGEVLSVNGADDQPKRKFPRLNGRFNLRG